MTRVTPELDQAIHRVRGAILRRTNADLAAVPGDYLSLLHHELPSTDAILADILTSIPAKVYNHLPGPTRVNESLFYSVWYSDFFYIHAAARARFEHIHDRLSGTNFRETNIGDNLVPVLTLLPDWQQLAPAVSSRLENFPELHAELLLGCEIVADFLNALPVAGRNTVGA